jgi:hypothetical protein
MSDLGEISSELTAALDRLDRVLGRFLQLDRETLAPLQAEATRDPRLRQVAALIARARGLVRQAGDGTLAARGAGADWLAQHGAADAGGSGAWHAFDGGHGGERSGSPGPGSGSPAVEAAWAERLRTPGGMAYYPSSDFGLRAAAATLPPFSGEYTFDAHGRGDCVEFGRREMSAGEIAELIRADNRWGGRPVRLFSCNTGRGESPVAAELAKVLGVRVVAPDDLAWSAADGWTGVAPVKQMKVNGVVVEVPDRDHEGAWRVFDPPAGAGGE